jgi:hypothetical protein
MEQEPQPDEPQPETKDAVIEAPIAEASAKPDESG